MAKKVALMKSRSMVRCTRTEISGVGQDNGRTYKSIMVRVAVRIDQDLVQITSNCRYFMRVALRHIGGVISPTLVLIFV